MGSANAEVNDLSTDTTCASSRYKPLAIILVTFGVIALAAFVVRSLALKRSLKTFDPSDHGEPVEPASDLPQ